MPEALKLYHAPASPNSRRVRMFLAEKGISLPLVSIDLAAGETWRRVSRNQSAPRRLEGFAAVMEGARNAAPRLAGRAIAGPHDYAQIPELVERSKRRVANFYSDMDARLADVSFIAGENFSAADITTLVAVDFATRALDIPVPAESRALRYWYDTVAARPSATA